MTLILCVYKVPTMNILNVASICIENHITKTLNIKSEKHVKSRYEYDSHRQSGRAAWRTVLSQNRDTLFNLFRPQKAFCCFIFISTETCAVAGSLFLFIPLSAFFLFFNFAPIDAGQSGTQTDLILN